MDLYGKHECPAGALVGHQVHGRGRVICKFGDSRMVKFDIRVEKTREEMTELELIENCFDINDDVISVAWVSSETKVVPVSQLKFFVMV